MVDFPYKVRVPQRPPQLVARERLREQMATIRHKSLLTITAPAGYGKTSLLIDFAHSAPPLPVCWYTLDRFDADPWAFVSYVAASVQQRFPEAMAQTQQLLAGSGAPSLDVVVAALTRDIYTLGEEFALVLDDWHLVDANDDISAAVAHLLTRCPNCHVILASRSYPSLPDLMLLMARQRLLVVDDEGLRFTPPEALAVLRATYNAPLPLDRAAALVEQTHGWITGVLLCVQAAGPAPRALPEARFGAERQIYQFLAEQVFDSQPPALQSFLLDTALLEEITAERSDEVLGRDDSRQLLNELLRRHLFISEVSAHSFRYHPLFHEFLLEHYRTLDAARYRATALRVAAHYRRGGQWAPAFAMCLAAGDLDAAQEVVAEGGEQLFTNGRLDTLESWFNLLPTDDLTATLLCLKARVALNRRQHHEAQLLADLAQARARADERHTVLVLHALLARFEGRYADALEHAARALAIADTPAQRATALRTSVLSHLRAGDTAAAIDAGQQALAIERARGDVPGIAAVSFDLGLCYEAAGQLGAAAEHYSYADASFAACLNLGQRAMSLNSKGVVQHLAGQYREAHATLQQALSYSQDSGVRHYQATVLASLGDLYSDVQRWPQAAQSYEAARAAGGSAFLRSYLDIAEIRLALRQHRIHAAAFALDRLPDATRAHFPGAVLLLRASIACGQGDDDAARDDVREATAQLGPSAQPIEAARLALAEAQVAALGGDDAPVAEALERAAQLAAPLGGGAFLIADSLALASLVRRAQAAGWPRAAEWLLRQQQLRQIGRALLDEQDQRPVLTVQALGGDAIALDGEPVELGWAKAREVLFFLLEHPTGASNEALCEALWPEREGDRARSLLKTAVYRLRSVLPPDAISLQRRTIFSLNRDVVRLQYDAERFGELLDALDDSPEALDEAITLYNGHFLPQYDGLWCAARRTQLEERYAQALQTAARRCEAQRSFSEALLLYRQLLALNPLHELAHAGVMRCQFAQGNRAAAIAQYRELCRLLDEEMGLDPVPSSEAAQLFHTILRADSPLERKA
jgi:ATP/maltotriose-dependent transcriptional regulator MalT